MTPAQLTSATTAQPCRARYVQGSVCGCSALTRVRAEQPHTEPWTKASAALVTRITTAQQYGVRGEQSYTEPFHDDSSANNAYTHKNTASGKRSRALPSKYPTDIQEQTGAI
jgi:hypothetical protein